MFSGNWLVVGEEGEGLGWEESQGIWDQHSYFAFYIPMDSPSPPPPIGWLSFKNKKGPLALAGVA